MKKLFKFILQKFTHWVRPAHELDFENFERLESKKYQKRGGFYGE